MPGAGAELTPGDIVIMGNLSSHEVPDAREAIEAAGATLINIVVAQHPVQWLEDRPLSA